MRSSGRQDLIAKRVTSEANLDTARAKRDTASAAVNKIQAVIAQKTIKAPVSGRLGIRKVERGQYVSPGMVLVTLQQLDPIRVDFPMPEQLISKLRVGQQLEVTVDTFPGEVFKGEIESLDARVAQDTRTLLVRGSLPNGRASCCRACSPTWWCWPASRGTSSPCPARPSPTASTATASTR